MAMRYMFRASELCQICGQKRSVLSDRLFGKRHFKRVRDEEHKIRVEIDPPVPRLPPENNGSITPKTLLKPLAFTISFSAACYTGAAIWQYENVRKSALRVTKDPGAWISKKIIISREKTNDWKKELKKWWNTLSEGEKIFVPICALNVLVFCAWRLPQMQPLMLKYFCSNPASKATCWPMLLSTFSHYSAFHLFANMYVLHSFSSGAVHSMGKEQFVGFYLAAGVLSSFASHFHKVVRSQPGLSIGASGAIMAVLGYVCTQYPDTKLGIIFLPFFTFSAGTAIKAIMALDITGLVLGWRMFDHAAHLGGAAFGIFWAVWGQQHLWQKRNLVLNEWHNFRTQK